jgi:hypothetical protein
VLGLINVALAPLWIMSLIAIVCAGQVAIGLWGNRRVSS